MLLYQPRGMTTSQIKSKSKWGASLRPVTKLILNKHCPFVIISGELGSCLWHLNTRHIPVSRENLKSRSTDREGITCSWWCWQVLKRSKRGKGLTQGCPVSEKQRCNWNQVFYSLARWGHFGCTLLPRPDAAVVAVCMCEQKPLPFWGDLSFAMCSPIEWVPLYPMLLTIHLLTTAM